MREEIGAVQAWKYTLESDGSRPGRYWLSTAILAALTGDIRWLSNHRIFSTEARNLHEAGITALQALQPVTTKVTSLLGMEGKVGRLVRGALPDVVLLEANPLESAAALERVSTISPRAAWSARGNLRAPQSTSLSADA